ncbi:hypothetical protein VitviT2T_013784 [Vitis vinifera]|uniref:Serine-rich protein-like protein n=2 Tax=Vitis vinifera TaxID=29760 RepID=A0ABY9CHT1_VITVI|nr:uncharacterized protein LOC100242170 [Vitis vinifera]WJZ94983.1 hypothetical protein VitviT2T_013784 [Vitis vinifera]|eukprot:XP_002271365.1 PREDICTED: uncharacterized protein LOC100242170 [Vitis vinifera]
MTMANSSRSRSRGPNLQRSLSPSAGRFCSSSISSTSAFYSRSSDFFKRSSSPTRVNLYRGVSSSPSPSVRFSIEPQTSPRRSISVSPRDQVVRKQNTGSSRQKRTCLCSPTTHPGSFRCSMHKNANTGAGSGSGGAYQSNRLNARRSAMTNSLVRIGGVEGDLVKRALSALIRPSSHQQRRRAAFEPRLSRLSIMSMAGSDDL